MEITVTFTVTADVQGWADIQSWARGQSVTVDEATKEIFEYLATVPNSSLRGQTFLRLDSTAVIES